MRRVWLGGLLLILLCSGCLSANELLVVPRPGVPAVHLQSQIDALLASDYRAGAPVSGDNRQYMQMRDLDGDGQDEALLFLRSAADSTQRSIMLFSRHDDEYERNGTITVVATGIQSVSYADLDGDGLQEVLVGWSTENLNTISVYAIQDGTLAEISEPISYQKYTITNLRGADNTGNSLIVIRVDPTQRLGYAEMYDKVNGTVQLSSSANLSQNVSGINRLRVGSLRDGTTGVYISSSYMPPQLQEAPQTASSSPEVTDILCLREDALVNVTLNMETGVSDQLLRSAQVSAADINHDGILDLARIAQLPTFPQPPDSEAEPDILYEYLWYCYDSTGKSEFVARTYHSVSSARSWYIILGENWPDRYTVRRATAGTTVSATFFYWPDEEADPLKMLTITSISRTAGDTAEIMGRIILDETTTHVIVGEIFELPLSLRAYALSENELKSMFSLVEFDWR